MQRFFCPYRNIVENKIFVSDKERLHHIKDVLRFKEGDEIIIFDDRGNEYHCAIEKISSRELIATIKNRHIDTYVQGRRITVACAIPKKSKMDDIIDKLTQLGVDKIMPLKTERVVVKLDKNKEVARLERWKKIALSAAQQSQRKTIPSIELAKDISAVLANAADYDLKLIPTLAEKQRSVMEVFKDCTARHILVLIGPEGDFTPQEVGLAKKAGCIPISLGRHVLRVETAAIAITSFIMLYENS